MTEKLTLKTAPRQKKPFVTKADTASDDLKARTLAAMAQREQENKGKIKSIRQMPKLALAAAIIVLTLLVATGAAFALRYWFEDVFDVDQTQTVNGYTLSVKRARISGDFLFVELYTDYEAYIYCDGTISNDGGASVNLNPAYGEETFTFYAPDIKKVVNTSDKNYQCTLNAYLYTSKKTRKADYSDAEAVFRFTFEVANQYVRSVDHTKVYDIDYRVDLDGMTLDFQKYYATDVESILLAEVINDEHEGKDVGEFSIVARVLNENGEPSKGYFLGWNFYFITDNEKKYLLMTYCYDNKDGYTYGHYMLEDSEYDDDGHNAEREYERLSIKPPFRIEIESIQWKTFTESNRKEVYTKIKDVDIPVTYKISDKPIFNHQLGDNLLMEVKENADKKKLTFTTSDGKAAYRFNQMWIYDDVDKIFDVNVETNVLWGLEMHLESKTDKRPYWDMLKESGYLILAGYNGKKEVLRYRLDSEFNAHNSTEMQADLGLGRGEYFTVSNNPLNKYYIKNYYNEDYLEELGLVFYQDISQWRRTDLYATEINCNTIFKNLGVDHFKLIAAVNYVDFYENTETYWELDFRDEDYEYMMDRNNRIEKITYISTDSKYDRNKLHLATLYDTVPHCIAKEKPENYLWPLDRPWTAEEFTFTVK